MEIFIGLNTLMPPVSQTDLDKITSDVIRHSEITADAVAQRTLNTALQLAQVTRDIASGVETTNTQRFASIKRWNHILLVMNGVSIITIVLLASNFYQFVAGFVSH